MKIVIHGRPISKKNSKQVINIKGRLIPISSKAYNQFRKDALKQIVCREIVEAPYFVWYKFEMKGRLDADIDNLIAGINDILQEKGVINDDKNILCIQAVKVPLCKDWITEIEVQHYAPDSGQTS